MVGRQRKEEGASERTRERETRTAARTCSYIHTDISARPSRVKTDRREKASPDGQLNVRVACALAVEDVCLGKQKTRQHRIKGNR